MQYQICKKYAQYAAWTYEIYMHNKHKYAKICKQIYAYMQKKKKTMHKYANNMHKCTNMQFQNMHKDAFYVCVCVSAVYI